MPHKKLSKAFTNRYTAYVLARTTYRDTDLLENHHTQVEQLSIDFYTQMLSEVQKNYNEVFPQITALIEGRPPQSEDEKILSMWLLELLYSMNRWFPPKKVHNHYKGSVAEFILNGEFRSACIKQLTLDDELMMKLNIDVHNRFYTLACRNVLK